MPRAPSIRFSSIDEAHSRKFICSMDGAKSGVLVRASRPILLPDKIWSATQEQSEKVKQWNLAFRSHRKGGLDLKRKDHRGRGIQYSVQNQSPPSLPGKVTLYIVAENPDKFTVMALPVGSNVTFLANQNEDDLEDDAVSSALSSVRKPM
ncbi:unnamed protein product [Dovyalis caffra]|uniref:Uncharacterized protein n=1 Tax=Dovyalis caffra TaxID=77055 RepID=A0AAV1SFE3_9ROSI|nr:unnamed protein product [Dovyalis caffra]